MTALREPVDLATADATAPTKAAPARLTRTQRRVRLVARTLVTLQVLVVTWAVFRGFFYFHDDFAFRGQGARVGWWDAEYLLQNWQGHFMPAGFALSQPLSKLGDFSYAGIALTLATGQAVTAVLLLRLLVRHFGLRWRILLPLLAYLTSVAVVQAVTWWAAAMPTIPLLLVLVLLSDRTLRTRGHRTPGFAWWASGLYATGLLFTERAVLLPVWVFLLLTALAPGRWRSSVAATLRRHARTWVLMVLVTAGWAVAYLLHRGEQTVPRPTLDEVAGQLGGLVTHQLLPSLVGGGWTWERIPGVAYDLAHASWGVTLLGLAVAIAGLTLLLPAGPRARRALGAVLGYGIAVLALLAAGRQFPLYVAADHTLPRYFAELAPALAVGLALATARLLHDPAPDMLREFRPTTRAATVVPLVALGQVVVLLWATSVVGLVDQMSSSPDRTWTLNALRSLRSAPASTPLLDQIVPRWVVDPLLYPANRYSWFFAGTSGIPPIGDVTDRLRTLDDTGALVDAHLEGPRSISGPVPDCGWPVQGDSTRIPFDGHLINWVFVVHIAYISTSFTSIEARFDDGPTRRVAVSPGLHDVYFWLEGGGDNLHLSTTTPGATVCVGAVRAGNVASGLPELGQP